MTKQKQDERSEPVDTYLNTLLDLLEVTAADPDELVHERAKFFLVLWEHAREYAMTITRDEAARRRWMAIGVQLSPLWAAIAGRHSSRAA